LTEPRQNLRFGFAGDGFCFLERGQKEKKFVFLMILLKGGAKMQEKVVLICGSRSIKKSWFCEVLVKSLISQNVKIIVGDAPGIDELVINTCIKHNYKNIVVVGAYNKIRRNQALKYGLTTVKYPHDFLSRNRYMVSLSDSVIAIWDGVSRGTKYTFNYAQKQGKEVIVVIQKS